MLSMRCFDGLAKRARRDGTGLAPFLAPNELELHHEIKQRARNGFSGDCRAIRRTAQIATSRAQGRACGVYDCIQAGAWLDHVHHNVGRWLGIECNGARRPGLQRPDARAMENVRGRMARALLCDRYTL